MTREDALERLKAILGKGLYPTAIAEVEKTLAKLEENSFEAGFEHAKETVGAWYEPEYEYERNEGYE